MDQDILSFNGYYFKKSGNYYRCVCCHNFWKKIDQVLKPNNRGHNNRCLKTKSKFQIKFKNESVKVMRTLKPKNNRKICLNRTQTWSITLQKLAELKITEEAHEIKFLKNYIENIYSIKSKETSDGNVKVKFLRNESMIERNKYQKPWNCIKEHVRQKILELQNTHPSPLVEDELGKNDKSKFSLALKTLAGISIIIKDSNAPFDKKDLFACLHEIGINHQLYRFLLKGRDLDICEETLKFRNNEIIHVIFRPHKEIRNDCEKKKEFYKEMREDLNSLSKIYEDYVEIKF